MVTGLVTRRQRLVLYDPKPYRTGRPVPWSWPLLPAQQSYEADRAKPWGYHVEETPRWGLVTAGAIVFGVVYGASALIGATGLAEGEDGEPVLPLLIPIAGPFITMKTTDDPTADSTGPNMALAANGVAQGVGLGLLLGGLASSKEVLMRNDLRAASWTPHLVLGPTAAACRWHW